ncbi:MAG: oligosaccharide flippase family protein, partial [Acidobacteriota bacterium]
FFPALSRIQKETEKISNIYLISIEILFVLGATLSIFYYSFAEEIIMILLGGKWLPAIDMLKILSFGVLFRVSYKFCDLISKSVGQVFQMAWRQGLYALTVLISVYIGSQFSLSLVSGGIVISVIINYLLMSQLVVSILKIGLRKYLKIHMAGFFLGGYLFLVSTGFKILLIDFPDNLYLKLFMKATFFLVALSIFLFIYPRSFLSDELLKFFADLKIKNPILSKIVQKKFHN